MYKDTIVKIGTIMMSILIFVQFTPPVFGQGFGGVAKQASKIATSDVPVVTGVATPNIAQGIRGRNLPTIISRADTLIANRITSLNTELSRIQNDTTLSDNQKTSLTSQIQEIISGLTNLKAKIDADTTVNAAYTDSRQIFTNYRVYAVAEPKTRITIVIENLQSVTARLQALTPGLQSLAATLESQGKEATQLTPLITDINTQLSAINTLLNTDLTSVQNVTVNTQNPDTVLGQVKNDIKLTTFADFQKIRTDLQQIKIIFKQLGLPDTPSTPSGIPSAAITQPTASSSSIPIVVPNSTVKTPSNY